MQDSRALPDSFEGGAFHPQFGKGKASGSLHVSHSGVKFVSEKGGVELPLAGLEVAAGGASNRLLFFKHARHPEWSLFTSDQRIIEHPAFAHDRPMQAQRGRIAGERWRGRGVVLAVLLVFVAALGGLYLAKDWMVARIAQQVPAEWEAKLGETVFAQLTMRKKVLTDPALLRQLEQLTKPLVAGARDGRYQFKFHLLEDPSLNAFALPGGTMAVHSGLLLAADSSEEVAGVLAHEMAHVTRQHGLRNIIETTGLYGLVQAFFGDASGLLAVVVNNAPFLLSQKFSRDYEREADEQGFRFLVAAKLNPRGMISFFGKLEQEQQRIRDKSPMAGVEEKLDFLSTHPATRERIERLEKLWAKAEKKDGFTAFNLNFKEFQDTLRRHLNRQPEQPPQK